MKDRLTGWFWGSLCAWLVLGVVSLVLLWGPIVGPWAQERKGLANFRQAEQERRILVEQALAEKDAAAHLAAAEIARAQGVAEANLIVAEGLGGPEGYLRYLWIQKLGENQQDVIYIPTEAGVPLLEAGRATK